MRAEEELVSYGGGWRQAGGRGAAVGAQRGNGVPPLRGGDRVWAVAGGDPVGLGQWRGFPRQQPSWRQTEIGMPWSPPPPLLRCFGYRIRGNSKEVGY